MGVHIALRCFFLCVWISSTVHSTEYVSLYRDLHCESYGIPLFSAAIVQCVMISKDAETDAACFD